MESCRWCGLIHGPKCPKVKAIEYQPDGATVKRVEFFSPQEEYLVAPMCPSSPGTYEPWWRGVPYVTTTWGDTQRGE
jgi:hypothetical protein